MRTIIGVPKEIKEEEYRVAIVPAGVEALVKANHTVIVQRGAGVGSGISDKEYKEAGAKIVPSAKDVYKNADIIVKVKEPLPEEYDLLKESQIVFTFFHFAASLKLTKAMLDKKIIGIAYETLEENNTLPLLTPMSEIAGRMAVQEGAKYLERPMMGRGVLLGGVPGVAPCKVVILGGGVVGTNAAKIASGMGAQVVILDIDLSRLRYLEDIMPKNVQLLMSNSVNIRNHLKDADLVIGAVLVKGAKAPILITKEMLKTMKEGSVIVDVAIDQGGCVETSRPTTHKNPVYKVHGVIHYCVSNMPGAVARTATFALTNATLPYVLLLANYREDAIKNFNSIRTGLNVYKGKITYKAIADTFNLPYTPWEKI
jgi:alanine dehydrogenase